MMLLCLTEGGYGSGMRVMECLRLRVKDLDFKRLQIAVLDTKGRQDRLTLLMIGWWETRARDA